MRSPNAVTPSTTSSTVFGMVRPPGEPVTSTRWPSRVTIAGDIELSIRFPGAIRFAGVPMSPPTFVSPGFLLKSPISLLRMNPAPRTTTPDP